MALGLSLAGALTAYLLCRLAARRVWLPNPVTVRSAHKRPVSRAGGAVVCAVLTAAAGVQAFADGWPAYAPLLALSLAAGLLGLLDDRRELGARAKLVLLLVIAGVAAWQLGPMPSPPGLVLSPLILYPLAALWLLGFVNVFNFLDGLNGMAAGTGMVLLAALAASGGAVAPLALLAIGPLLGFAILNVGRGEPFLGDAGSLALGVLIAGGALMAGDGPDSHGFWVVAAGSVPFVADAGSTLIARARRGENLLAAHAQHAYQRLARAGASHAGVASLYAGLAALGAGATYAMGAGSVYVTVPLTGLAWFASTRTFARQLARSTEARASRSSA